MTIEQAIRVKKALLALSDVLNISPQKLAEEICFMGWEDRRTILMEASRMWNEFEDGDFETKAKMLGYEVTKGCILR